MPAQKTLPRTTQPKIRLSIRRESGTTSQAAIDGDNLTPIMAEAAEDLLYTILNNVRMPSRSGSNATPPGALTSALTEEDRKRTEDALEKVGSFSLVDASPGRLAAIIRTLCEAMCDAGLGEG